MGINIYASSSSSALSAIRLVLQSRTNYRLAFISDRRSPPSIHTASRTYSISASSIHTSTASSPASTKKDTYPDPLAPDIATTPLGLPIDPIPLPSKLSSSSSSSHTRTRTLSRTELERLHRLSALNPPAEGSNEEATLLRELGELVALMDQVKDVQLNGMDEEGFGNLEGLLTEGVGEVVLDEEEGHEWGPNASIERGVTGGSSQEAGETGARAVSEGEAGVRGVRGVRGDHALEDGNDGRKLLEYATRRVGDYYASRSAKRAE